MNVLVYDADFRGHHLKYASMVIEASLMRGHHVTYAAPLGAFGSEEYHQFLMAMHGMFSEQPFTLPAKGYASKLREAVMHTVRLVQTIHRCKADVVVIPHLDLCFYAYGLIGSCLRLVWRRNLPVTGIQFAAIWAYDEVRLNLAKRLKKWIALYVVNHGPFARVLFIDEQAFRWFTRVKKSARVQIGLCPDPVESDIDVSVEECRAFFGIPKEWRVVGAVGGLNERKGIDILVRAFSRMSVHSERCLLLVGKQTPAVRRVVAEALRGRPDIADRIIELDSFVSTHLLQMAIKAADVISALYPCHCASASIVLRAAAGKKPVLASDRGWVARVVHQYGIGRTCNVGDLDDVCLGLEWAFNNPGIDVVSADQLAAQNTVEFFKRGVLWLLGESY